jgi:uncharacterized membrane protein (DUF2068 family)
MKPTLHVPATPVAPHHARPWRERDQLIEIIAIFKFVKAAGLIAVDFGAIRMLDPATAEVLQRWILALSESASHPRIQQMLELLAGFSPRKIQLIGAAALFYAVLYIVEGLGLWFEAKWAEYLTITATSLFIPLEVYEVIRRQTLPRFGALVINVVMVLYLIYRLRHPNERALIVDLKKPEHQPG